MYDGVPYLMWFLGVFLVLVKSRLKSFELYEICISVLGGPHFVSSLLEGFLEVVVSRILKDEIL